MFSLPSGTDDLIYVELLDEGAPTLRSTEAIPMGGNLYKLFPISGYDPELETWESLPGSIVKVKSDFNEYLKKILVAYKKFE